MIDIARFATFMAAAAAVFVAVVLFTTRRRIARPGSGTLLLLVFVVVVLGMLFARYAHIFVQPPWWLYYGVPAVVTLFLPPVVLCMKGREITEYIPLAVLMAPAIHVFFSIFVGWHDYMPFPIYIHSLGEMLHGIPR